MERSAGGERIKVTRYGRTLAALIPKSDLTKLEECEKGEPDASGSAPSEPASASPRRRKHA